MREVMVEPQPYEMSLRGPNWGEARRTSIVYYLYALIQKVLVGKLDRFKHVVKTSKKDFGGKKPLDLWYFDEL